MTVMAALLEREDKIDDTKTIVRTFSWKTYAEDPDDALARSLVLAEAQTVSKQTEGETLRNQWMHLFDSNQKVLKSVKRRRLICLSKLTTTAEAKTKSFSLIPLLSWHKHIRSF